ncbi:MAG: NUDIX domain-containing protein [Candidatus Shapirobacteria bacterium]|nr:NUDIX domain-containing protein [Candidatus Shapirobacteria bacterium]
MIGFQIKGDHNNPYHLSVSAVVFEGNKLALLKKVDGSYTLPRETINSNESLVNAIFRGLREELGINVSVEKFIGSLITIFKRPDNTKVEKTTLYFICTKRGETNKKQEEDELTDEVVWITKSAAQDLLKTSNNNEWKIVERSF